MCDCTGFMNDLSFLLYGPFYAHKEFLLFSLRLTNPRFRLFDIDY